MDILINNMELPKGDVPLVLIINSDGSVEEIDGSDEINATDAKAIELQPHGRLIDCDVLCKALLEAWHTSDKKAEAIISEVISSGITPLVSMIPTIVEAST